MDDYLFQTAGKRRTACVTLSNLRRSVSGSGRRSPRASAREDLRRNFCAAANSSIREVTGSRNSGVRSCRIREQGLNPKIQDQHLPGKIFAKLPDSLAPELLQLLTPEFFLNYSFLFVSMQIVTGPSLTRSICM